MGALIIIAVLVLVWAYKTGRPMKLVLTPEEAKAVRAKWWRMARFELKLWAGAFVLGYALAGNALVSEHWRWYVYVFIVWGSLLIFSRLAIWATVVWLALYFAAATFAHYLLKYDMPISGSVGADTIGDVCNYHSSSLVAWNKAWKASGQPSTSGAPNERPR